MTSAPQPKSPAERPSPLFQLRGGSFTLLVLRLDDPKDPVLFQALRDKVRQAPNFFTNAPVVIDLQNLHDAPPFNMAELGRRLRQHQLVPIGVQNGTDEQNRAAINAGWCLFPEGRQSPLREGPAAPAPAPSAIPAAAIPAAAVLAAANAPSLPPAKVSHAGTAAPQAEDAVRPEAPVKAESTPTAAAETGGNADADGDAGSPARLLTKPVRSGRKVYAEGGDLVVMASISAGAELLADGHIHVYGALRGRALAGVSGDAGARIFCQSLEAELVSIAGYWRVREDIPEELIGKPAQVFLDGDRITIEPLA